MGNFYSVLFLTHNVSHSCYQLLMHNNLHSILTEGDCSHLPVTLHSTSSPCQSEWLTSLGITRYQTVILLLSTLYIVTTTVNLFSCFQSFSVLIVLLAVAAIFIAVNTKTMDGQSKHFQLCLLVSTMLNWSFICLSEPDSSAPSDCSLIVHYISTAVNIIHWVQDPRNTQTMIPTVVFPPVRHKIQSNCQSNDYAACIWQHSISINCNTTSANNGNLPSHDGSATTICKWENYVNCQKA